MIFIIIIIIIYYDFNDLNYYSSICFLSTYSSHIHSHYYNQQSYWILAMSARDLILHVINYLTFCNAGYRLVTNSVLF